LTQSSFEAKRECSCKSCFLVIRRNVHICKISSQHFHSFRKKCPLYQAEPEKYHESDMPIDRYLKKIGESDGTTPDWLMKQDRIIELRQRSILAAAEYIVRGLDAINSMCWECRKVFKVSLNRCGKCDQAKYCSRECQVSPLDCRISWTFTTHVLTFSFSRCRHGNKVINRNAKL
jgi:hypothetical protein